VPKFDVRVPRAGTPKSREPFPAGVPAGVPADAFAFPEGGARVYDAAGERVRYCRSCDTETGEVERYDVRPDPDGSGCVFAIGDDGKCAVVAETRPAPLRVVPVKPGEPYLLPGESPDTAEDADPCKSERH
jgi:hypothetical protein